MRKKILLILLIFFSGCLQQSVDQTSESKKVSVEKKVVPVPYPEEAKSTMNPISDDEESLAIGKSKYEIFCVMCHGQTGKGGEEVTKSFGVDPSSLVSDSVKKRTDGELFWATSNGVNGTKMLQWSELLADEEIWHTINYIRVLQKQG